MRSQAIQGNQNVQIQDVDRALIQITFNQMPLTVPLEPAHVPVATHSPSPARLVRAHAGVSPYVDRGGFLADLKRWAESDLSFAGMVVGGRGGSGKTRLAVELCEDLRAKDWLCGFLSRITDQTMLEALVRAPTARLVVVDYAESRAEQLQILLPLLKASARRDQPVRVLLLVRAAPSVARDWPSRLRNQLDTLDAVLDDCGVQILEEAPLRDSERARLFTTAANAFASRLDRQVPAHHPPPALNEEAFTTPLMIVIAAYLAVHSDTAPPSTRSELLDEVLAHERRYWRESSAGLSADDTLLERIVALATLTSADSEGAATERLRLIPDLADAANERRSRLARWVQEQYPGPKWWNPVEPDLVGEYLVACCFTPRSEVLHEILRNSNPDEATRPLEVLARAALDHQDLEAVLRPLISDTLTDLCVSAVKQAEQVLDRNILYANPVTQAGALTAMLEAVEVDEQALADALLKMPPPGNILLNDLGVSLSRQRVERLQSGSGSSTHRSRMLGAALSDHSYWLHSVGMVAASREAVQEAVEIYRQIAEEDPTQEIYLAVALNNLASLQAENGELDKALKAGEEVVEIRRNAAFDPKEDGLASALNNLGNTLGLVGRHREALKAIEEATELYRDLAKAKPEMYEIRLAKAINNLSNCLGELGRHEEALAAIDESVQIRRPLAAEKPAAFDPELGRAVLNRGICLLDLNRNDEAVVTLEEAAKIYRPLAITQAEAHGHELIKILKALFNALQRSGHPEKATAINLELQHLAASLSAAQ